MNVLLVPYRHANRFVEINKRAIEDIGVEVLPLTLKTALSGTFSRQPIVVNWLEDRPYGSNFNFRVRLTTAVKSILIVLYGAIFCSKKIWIKHNFKPHNAAGNLFYFKLLTGLLKLLRFEMHTLEEYVGGEILHPLYLNDKEINDLDFNKDVNHFQYLVFGAIKKYKGVIELLEKWPRNRKLKIAGYCNDKNYEADIRALIEKRKLNVDWKNEFLTDGDLNKELIYTDFVVMSHQDNSMISSGSFYHAISYGCNILATSSQFSNSKSSQHSFVQIINDTEWDLEKFESNFVDKNSVIKSVVDKYGRNKLEAMWRKLLLGNGKS